MFLAKVIGTVWSSVKWPELEGLKLLLVRPYSLADLAGDAGGAAPAPTHDGVVCADILDAGVGDDVVIAYGHAARVAVSETLARRRQAQRPDRRRGGGHRRPLGRQQADKLQSATTVASNRLQILPRVRPVKLPKSLRMASAR